VPPREDISCLIKHHTVTTYWDSGGIAPSILDLGTRWRCVVSFTSRSPYPRGKDPGTHYMGGRMGPRGGSGCGNEEQKDAIIDPVGVRTQVVQPVRNWKERGSVTYSGTTFTQNFFEVSHFVQSLKGGIHRQFGVLGRKESR